MNQPTRPRRHYPTAGDDARSSERYVISPQTLSATYKLAFADPQFLLRDELRPVRLQLELMKPELILQEHGIENTIVVFGGTRIPESAVAGRQLRELEELARQDPQNAELARRLARVRRVLAKSPYYDEARKLGRLISENYGRNAGDKFVVVTGGGPGIMEAANRGAHDVEQQSIGLNIVLPHEQQPNPYISPELNFQFHYFALRKMHFLMRARALVAFPGGFGTMDELFETLTLIQTKKIKPVPVLLFGKEFWARAIDFDFLAAEGVIDPDDLELFRFVETAEEAWTIIAAHYDDHPAE